MKATPLSDLMDAADRDLAAYERFLQAFRGADVGVQAKPTPNGRIGVSAGRHSKAPGERFIMVFADPPAFAARFGQRFNAEMKGHGALETAAADPACAGVLVNSAKEETSVVIRRDVVLRLLGRAPEKPWWKFW